MSDRKEYIDAIRGLAIILVVVGHLIQFNVIGYEDNTAYNWIYSFHMPLFFFISGYVSFLSMARSSMDSFRSLVTVLEKKFFTLLFPSIVWTVLTLTVLKLDIPLTNRVSGYWFLNLLFVIESSWLVAIYAAKTIKVNPNICIACAILLLALFVSLGIKRVTAMYYILFILGYFCSKSHLISKLPPVAIIIVAILFTCCSFSFHYTEADSRVVLELPTSVMASLLLFWCFERIPKTIITTQLSNIGKYTLGIYLMHFLLVRIPGTIINSTSLFSVLVLPLSLIIAILCAVFQKTICRSGILGALLYGKNITSLWRK